METLRQIDPAEINPEDFKNTTLCVEPVDHPEDSFVAIVKTPRMIVGEGNGAVTIIDNGPGPEGRKRLIGPFVIPYDIFVNGGESGGLKFPGILEEAALKYGLR